MLLLKTIVLLGALQGFIVSVLLWASGRRRPEERASRWLLATLTLLFALACLEIYLIHTHFWTDTMAGSILEAIVPLIVVMPVGPLIYFYVRSCEEPDFRLTRRRRRHFYSVAIDLFQHAFILLFVIGLFARLIPPNKYHIGVWEDYYDQYADIPRWISLTIYLALASRYLRRRRAAAAPSAPDDIQRMNWLRRLLRVFWAFDIFWLAFLIPYELPRIGDELIDRFDWYPLYVPLVMIIYFLGANGYFITYRNRRPHLTDKKNAPAAIPADKLEQVRLRLQKSMEEEALWLDAGLNVAKLAAHCSVAPKTLSIVLNQYMGVTFTDFVNSYRVDAVKEKILMPESRRITIAGLAYDCGFNSLPTFQRAFKSATGMSPRQYLTHSGLE